MPDDAPTTNAAISRPDPNADVCSSLRRAFADRDTWESTAKQYALNATYWQEQAEQARSNLASMTLTGDLASANQKTRAVEIKLVGMRIAMQQWRALAGHLTEQLGPDADD